MSRPAEDRGTNARPPEAASNAAKSISQCPKCGTKMPASRPSDRCPVCQLRGALAAKTESALKDDSACSGVMPPEFELMGVSAGFDHYELLMSENGMPVELGHGAMGVTYKAFDTNLRCPVALKVITASLLDSENAAERFLREARVAGRLRHQNVASVFHLGTDHEC